MNDSTRIHSADTVADALTKLSEGNPETSNLLRDLVAQAILIDPFGDSNLVLRTLDTAGVYGARIQMLFKDVCSESASKTLAILRGFQLGIISQDQLDRTIDNHGQGLDVDATLETVEQCVPNFFSDFDSMLNLPIPAMFDDLDL